MAASSLLLPSYEISNNEGDVLFIFVFVDFISQLAGKSNYGWAALIIPPYEWTVSQSALDFFANGCGLNRVDKGVKLGAGEVERAEKETLVDAYMGLNGVNLIVHARH